MATQYKELTQAGTQAVLELEERGKGALIGEAERQKWNEKADPPAILQYETGNTNNLSILQRLHEEDGLPNVMLQNGYEIYTLVSRENNKSVIGYDYVFSGPVKDGENQIEYIVEYMHNYDMYRLKTRERYNTGNLSENGTLPPTTTVVKQALDNQAEDIEQVWQDLDTHMEDGAVHITDAERTLWNSTAAAGKDTYYGTCSSSPTTVTKIVNVESGFTLRTGVMVAVLFPGSATSTSDSTRNMNVNSTGSYPIQYNGSSALEPDMIPGGMRALFVFDGTAWQLLNPMAQKESLAFILSFGKHFSGKTFTVTGSGFSGYSSVVPEGGEITVGMVNAGQPYTVICDGYTKTFTPTDTNGIYRAYFNILSLNTWDEIQEASSSGMASKYWSVGDTIDITCTNGQVLTLQIYDFLHDDLANGAGKAGITFGLKNLAYSLEHMETAGFNTGGFVGTCLYDWLTEDLWNTLPADLRAVIQPVKKKTCAGGTSKTIRTDTVSVFLFSQVECMGSSSVSVSGEGTKYPIFTDNSSRVKALSNGTGNANNWWTRSPASSNTTDYVYISTTGGAGTYRASTNLGICFGFCI